MNGSTQELRQAGVGGHGPALYPVSEKSLICESYESHPNRGGRMGGSPKQITDFGSYPSWSPDGKHIAYEIRRGGDIHIVLIPSQGGTPTQLTFDPGQRFASSFSPDGDKIAFAGERNGVSNVYWISRTSRKQMQLTNYTTRSAYVRYAAWSPSGDQIVYERSETSGDIWLAEIKE
jgi:Tol biopolymer transport system component